MTLKIPSAQMKMYVSKRPTHGEGCFHLGRRQSSFCVCAFLKQWSFGLDVGRGAHIAIVAVSSYANAWSNEAGKSKTCEPEAMDTLRQ